MRREITFFATLAILIILATVELVYIRSVLNTLESQANTMHSALLADPDLEYKDQHLASLEELSRHWDKSRDNMLIIIPHILADEMTYRIITLRENLTTGDYDMAMVTVATISSASQTITKHFSPSIHTVL